MRTYSKDTEEKLAAILTRKAAQPMGTSDIDATSIKHEVADMFIDEVVDESVLLKAVRLHKTDASAGEVSMLNVSGPVTRGAAPNTAFTETRKLGNRVVRFATAKTCSALDLSGEVQEDTIEGSNGKNKFISMFAKAVSNDMESLAIEGDESIQGTTDIEELLKVNNGYLVQTDAADNAHVVDASGHRAGWLLLKAMMRAMPTKWRKNLAALRWVMSANTALDVAEDMSARSTAVADAIRTTGGVLPALLGVLPLVVPYMPEDLSIGGTAGIGSAIWLVDPQNFIYVVQRDVTIEWMRQPRADTDEATIHMRTDFLVETPDAVVKTINVLMDEDGDFYGHTA